MAMRDRHLPRKRLLDAAVARLCELVRDAAAERGDDPDSAPVAANVAYNTTDCRHRVARLAAYLRDAHQFVVRGKTVAELGCGFGGSCLHWMLEHGAAAILAVDHSPPQLAALQTIIREFDLPAFTLVPADLQTAFGHEGAADLVVLNDVLYTANLCADRVAASCARLLRPGGVVLFRHVNRACGRGVVSHTCGTQFLDPDSANRAARFASCGTVSTLDHRPLSPWGLAAFLRQAGFGDIRFDTDFADCSGLPQATRGLRPRYVLSGRRWLRPPALRARRIAPPPNIGPDLTLGPAASVAASADEAMADNIAELCSVFGAGLSPDIAAAELRSYLRDALLVGSLRSFGKDEADGSGAEFARAIEQALDYALIAVLTRYAGWTEADFAAAQPERLALVLAGSRRGIAGECRQRVKPPRLADAAWEAASRQAVSIVLPGVRRRSAHAAYRIAERRLRDIVADRQSFRGIRLFARTADPVTGSMAEEYAEAAIDRIEGEIRDVADPAEAGARSVCHPELVKLVEAIEAAARAG